jgi:hypothetical protein
MAMVIILAILSLIAFTGMILIVVDCVE